MTSNLYWRSFSVIFPLPFEQQEFTTPINWSTFDVARIKLHALKYKFYDFCTLMFLDENLAVWKEESQEFENVDGKAVACHRVFERVDLSEWLSVEEEAEELPTRKFR